MAAMPEAVECCPVCEGTESWVDERGRWTLCSYCKGVGRVSSDDARDPARYGLTLRKLNDGEVPFLADRRPYRASMGSAERKNARVRLKALYGAEIASGHA